MALKVPGIQTPNPFALTPRAPTTTRTTPPVQPSPSTTVPGSTAGLPNPFAPTPAAPGVTKQPGYQIPPVAADPFRALREQERKALTAGVPAETVQEISKGERPGRFVSVLGKVAEFGPVKYGILKPLETIDTGRRAVISTMKEVNDAILGPQKFAATDYKPINPATGKPYKTGDVVPAQMLPSGKQRKASFEDWRKQTSDFAFGYGDVAQTGNKWLDRVTGFVGDVVFDPITWVTGPGGLVKSGLTATYSNFIGKRFLSRTTARQTARVAAREAAEVAVEEARDAAARTAAGTAARAAADDAVRAAERQAAKAATRAATQAPARTYGRVGKETLANEIRIIRNEALQEAADASIPAAQRAVARNTANALTDDLIKEVASKGYAAIRGPAARALGVQGGFRIGLPGGPKLAIMPKITAPITDAIGTGFSKIKLGGISSGPGLSILNKITPMGERGLFSSDDILRMRTSLQSGKIVDRAGKVITDPGLASRTATEYVAMLAADRQYRGYLNIANRRTTAAIRPYITGSARRKTLNGLRQHLDTPESQWAARGLRALSGEERVLYDNVRKTLDDFWEESNSISQALGGSLKRIDGYLPHTQSRQAADWARRNAAKLEKAATDAGVDPSYFLTNFIERKLIPGKVWFGHVLTADDIAGGVARLNQIARESGRINFDWFTTDVADALAGYAAKIARFNAYGRAITVLPQNAPEIARASGRATAPIAATAPSGRGLSELDSVINSMMTPEKLANWTADEAQEAYSRLVAISDRLNQPGQKLIKEEFEEAILEIDDFIRSIDRQINNGRILPESGGLLVNEAENYANALTNWALTTRQNFLVTDPKRWETFIKVFEDFSPININTIPNVQVRNEIRDIFTNVKRLEDVQFGNAATRAVEDYNTFFKAWVTATPGFHLRNSLTNVFMMIGAGANPVYLGQGVKVYNKWLNDAFRAARRGEALQAGKWAADNIPSAPKRIAFLEALEMSGASGFGQTGEVFAGTRRAGVLGREATENLKIPFTEKFIKVPGKKQTSLAVGAPLRVSRKFGEWIESSSRFGLTYSGILEGLSPAQAVGRTQKYLIDYADLSSADKIARRIIPFWQWASRNVPLQVENMWMKPRAYAAYNSFRRNLEDKEGTSPFLPEYRKEAGAFKLPFGENLYAQPDIGFPGAGQPESLQQFLGTPEELLSRVTPVARVPLELWKGRQFFSGAPLRGDDVDKYVIYPLQQLNAPQSLIARVVNMTPARRSKFMEKVFGTRRLSAEEEARGQEIQATLSYFGVPAFKLLPSQERNEIWRRFYQLVEEVDKVKEKKKEEERERRVRPSGTTLPPGELPNPFGP